MLVVDTFAPRTTVNGGKCICSEHIIQSNRFRKHLYLDLQPYTCLFAGCAFSAQPFADRQLWSNHLELDHRLGPDWGSVACPLCLEWTESGKSKMLIHFARHMEDIALAALPREVDDESGTGTDDSSQNSSKSLQLSTEDRNIQEERRPSPMPVGNSVTEHAMSRPGTNNDVSLGFAGSKPGVRELWDRGSSQLPNANVNRSHPLMISTTFSSCRCKVYELRENDWHDRGTGFSKVIEIREAHWSIVVWSEDDNLDDDRRLLLMPISRNARFQKPQDTIIVWLAQDGTDMALSFQEPEGCSAIWSIIDEVSERAKHNHFDFEDVHIGDGMKIPKRAFDIIRANQGILCQDVYPSDETVSELAQLAKISVTHVHIVVDSLRAGICEGYNAAQTSKLPNERMPEKSTSITNMVRNRDTLPPQPGVTQTNDAAPYPAHSATSAVDQNWMFTSQNTFRDKAIKMALNETMASQAQHNQGLYMNQTQKQQQQQHDYNSLESTHITQVAHQEPWNGQGPSRLSKTPKTGGVIFDPIHFHSSRNRSAVESWVMNNTGPKDFIMPSSQQDLGPDLTQLQQQQQDRNPVIHNENNLELNQRRTEPLRPSQLLQPEPIPETASTNNALNPVPTLGEIWSKSAARRPPPLHLSSIESTLRTEARPGDEQLLLDSPNDNVSISSTQMGMVGAGPSFTWKPNHDLSPVPLAYISTPYPMSNLNAQTVLEPLAESGQFEPKTILQRDEEEGVVLFPEEPYGSFIPLSPSSVDLPLKS